MAKTPNYRFAVSIGDGGPSLILKDYSAPYDRQDVLILSYEDAARRLLAHEELISALRRCRDELAMQPESHSKEAREAVAMADAALAKARAASKE